MNLSTKIAVIANTYREFAMECIRDTEGVKKIFNVSRKAVSTVFTINTEPAIVYYWITEATISFHKNTVFNEIHMVGPVDEDMADLFEYLKSRKQHSKVVVNDCSN